MNHKIQAHTHPCTTHVLMEQITTETDKMLSHPNKQRHRYNKIKEKSEKKKAKMRNPSQPNSVHNENTA